MKETTNAVIEIIGCSLLGIACTAATLLILSGLMAIPRLLEWLSGYVGEFFAYGSFIVGMLLAVYYGLTRAK